MGETIGAQDTTSSEATEARTSALRPIEQPLAGARCLLAEDESVLAAVQKRHLERLGASVVIAPTLLSAMKLLSSGAWEVIVADLRFPDGDGEPLLRAAQRIAPRSGFLFMSGVLDAVRPGRLRKLGATVIDKTGDPKLLGRVVHALLAEVREPGGPLARALRAVIPESTEIERALAAFSLKYRFSPQQTQMLALLTGGVSNKEIGGEFGIAEETLRVQWSRMVTKIRLPREARAREVLLAEFARFCTSEIPSRIA